MALPTERQLRQELTAAWDMLNMERRANVELRKDAERYRWLRLQCNTKTNLVQYRHGRAEYLYTCNSDDDMDDAIDRGRAVGAA